MGTAELSQLATEYRAKVEASRTKATKFLTAVAVIKAPKAPAKAKPSKGQMSSSPAGGAGDEASTDGVADPPGETPEGGGDSNDRDGEGGGSGGEGAGPEPTETSEGTDKVVGRGDAGPTTTTGEDGWVLLCYILLKTETKALDLTARLNTFPCFVNYVLPLLRCVMFMFRLQPLTKARARGRRLFRSCFPPLRMTAWKRSGVTMTTALCGISLVRVPRFSVLCTRDTRHIVYVSYALNAGFICRHVQVNGDFRVSRLLAREIAPTGRE